MTGISVVGVEGEAFKVMEKEYNTDEAGLCERCTLNPSRVCLGCATFAEDEP